jgi:Zn-dependent M28 family amino/carboxypeptidase
MPGDSYSGSLTELSQEEMRIKANLQENILILSNKIGERNIWNYTKLNAAADFIAQRFRELGYQTADQVFSVDRQDVKNIEVELPGSDKIEEIIIIGAHYDSCFGTTGANDNATGVAALIELARLVRDNTLNRTMRFVAFVNEEPPFFQTNEMGSYVYAKRARQRKENIIAMLSLETIGYYNDAQGSQKYPFPFSLFYPNVGNFIGFVGNLESKDLVQEAIASFRNKTKFPSQGIAAAQWLPGIGWSDQWAFWKENYPAIMITDTAPYRYPYYHTALDTANNIDYDCTARVVAGLKYVILDLANVNKI